MIEQNKDAGEPVQIEKAQMRRLLYENGADQSVLSDFDAAYDEAVGEGVPLMAENLVDTSRFEVKSPSLKISVKSDMSDMLKNFYSNSRINSCFIASANGFCIFADERSAAKTGENQGVKYFPVRQRPWYKGAAESDGIYFSDVERDTFTDNIGIVCSIPVYVDGKLYLEQSVTME